MSCASAAVSTACARPRAVITRVWYKMIDGILRGHGLTRTELDFGFYHMRVDGDMLLVCLDVDDLLIAPTNQAGGGDKHP